MNRKVKNVQTLKLYIFFGYINGGFDISTLYGIAFWNSWSHGSTYTVFFKIVESVRINNEARIVQNLVILISVSMLMEFLILNTTFDTFFKKLIIYYIYNLFIC